jgi:hypothetical protein
MPSIRITEETMRMIRSAAIYEFRQTGQRQDDGTWLIAVGDEVAARLSEAVRPGETVDDAIQRIIRQHRGGRPN